MKKRFTVLAAGTMAFSMIYLSIVNAEDTTVPSSKTSADFKDLANVDAALKAKIDALLQKGVFDGVTNDSFGIDENMTRAQMAKVVTLIYGINVDNNVKSSTFSDVKADDASNSWAIPYIEAAKKAGLIDGETDTTFSPGDNATLGEFATTLVKGLGKKVNVSGSPWYSDAVKQAVNLNILPSDADGSKFATRKDLLIGAFGGEQAKADEQTPTPTPTVTPTPTPTATPTPTNVNCPVPTDTTVTGNTYNSDTTVTGSTYN